MDIDIKKILRELHDIGLTQTQIGEEVGCSQPAISDFQSGKIGASRPSYKVVTGLKALADKYGIAYH